MDKYSKYSPCLQMLFSVRRLFWLEHIIIIIISYLELLGVRSRVGLGSPRTRLLFLPLLFLLLPFSPQIPSRTPARTSTNGRKITVTLAASQSSLSQSSRELTLATIATTKS